MRSRKFDAVQLSRVLSHVGEMADNDYRPGPGCLVQTALISMLPRGPRQFFDAEVWFDEQGMGIRDPDELLRAMEERGLA